MRPSLITLIFLVIVVLAHGTTATDVKRRPPFGSIEDPATKEANTVVLMRTGFFTAPVVADFPKLVRELLVEFPDATLVRVAKTKGCDLKAPEEILTYVWIIAKGKNLNVEMVRRGWFEGRTQLSLDGIEFWMSMIPANHDQAFVQQVIAAEEEARNAHRGIWKKSSG